MIQLKVYEGSDKLRSAQYWIELYETEPIKLTLSIEDLTNADATSTYSKAFKVPGTRKNAEFFKNSFDVDGTLYDVTTKKLAEILVDGTEFKQGHVRMQKVFFNTELDRYDYELLFLGETRDFSSLIGDAGLCDLDMPDLVGGPTGAGLTVTDIVTSWDAWDGTNGTINSGLHNGDIIYPLIDHGNSYTSTGVPEQSEISFANVAHSKPFTNSSYPLEIDRLKPMIRAKRIVDEIFTKAGYTYTSQFFNSNLFHQIYISAFGNEATVSYAATDGGPNSINTAYGDNLVSTQGVTIAPFPNPTNGLSIPNNQVDVGNNLSNWVYTVPVGVGSYTFEAECFYDGYFENSDYSRTDIPARLVLRNYSKNIDIHTSNSGSGVTLQFTHTQAIQSGFFEAGDQIGILVRPNSGVDWDIVTNVKFAVTSAPGVYSPSSGLECSYKQIDFIKDILTAFRLVLSPDPKDPKNFIIEPWQTYINSGNVYNWSHKLVENKDVVIEPVFFSQSDTIKFDMQPGGDYTNIYHQQAYSENYGYLEFNSGNELLKGKRDVKLIGIAPTPIVPLEGSVAADNVTIPQLHQHDEGQHLPIKTKTRMLFYNGKQPFTHPTQNRWYLTNVQYNIYPMVSPYQEWPIQPQTLNLNWANDIQYWGIKAGYNDNGSTLYSDYWSRYISSLYNKYSRRVTAYFVLNNIDLNDFSFDDTIFVNGTYYRPEKIIDVEVGAYTEVKVQLLTANDYKPKVVLDEELTNLSAVGYGGGCGEQDLAKITVTTDGTPGFTWTLSDGTTGTALQNGTVGQAPYTFVIEPVTPGTTTVNIVDVLGRTGSVVVNVPLPSIPNIEANPTITDATDCQAPCNGSASVSPSGGQAPYTIQWNDEVQPGTNFNRTDLCPGQYDYIVYDANGCSSAYYLVEIECETPETVWYYARDFDCQTLDSRFVKVFVPTGTVPDPVNDIVGLSSISTGQGIPGCYRPIYQTSGPADYNLAVYWQDCESCNGIQPGTGFYLISDCESGQNWMAPASFNFNIGDVVQYTKNIAPGTIWCGTIVNFFQDATADATLYSPNAYSCGDNIHCEIPAP